MSDKKIQTDQKPTEAVKPVQQEQAQTIVQPQQKQTEVKPIEINNNNKEDEDKKVYVSKNEFPKLKRDLYLDVSKSIYYEEYKNYRIDDTIKDRAKGVVQSYYFMQGSLTSCLTYFGGKILFSRKSRYIKNNLDMAFILMLTFTAGLSGFIYNGRVDQISTYFQWENGKFKNLSVIEYKKDPVNYVKYLLEE